MYVTIYTRLSIPFKEAGEYSPQPFYVRHHVQPIYWDILCFGAFRAQKSPYTKISASLYDVSYKSEEDDDGRK